MLASALNVVIGQRLLRHVAKPKHEPAEESLEQEIRTAMVHIKAQAPHFELPEFSGNITQPDMRVSKFTHGYQ
jgi:type II secretory ATPase GspE/PulE/Tfp pilus assembly ATPase PilB-like protein